MLTQLFNNPTLYSLALTLLHFLWQGFLIALVLKSILLVVSKDKSLIRYTAASVAMLLSLIIPIFTFYVIYSSIAIDTSPLIEQIQLTHMASEFNLHRAWFDYQELMTGLPEFLTFILPYISVAWFVVVSFLSCKLLIELNNVNKLPKTGTIEPESELANRFMLLAKQIGLIRVPKLLISLHVSVPMVIGWLKPVVLIPASMVTGLNTAQLEMLMLHELAHIRRHDYLVNFLQTFVEILFFFHPSIHWISRQMRNEREYCSDDIAVQHCGDAVAYAHTLADTAALRHAEPRYCENHTHTIPELAMAASGGDLKQRIVRLVNHHCAPNKDIGKWFAAASIIASVLFVTSQSLISLSNFALESQSQKPLAKPFQESYSSNNHLYAFDTKNLEITNNRSDEPALTTIAGSLLNNYNDSEAIGSYKESFPFEQITPVSFNSTTTLTLNESSQASSASAIKIVKKTSNLTPTKLTIEKNSHSEIVAKQDKVVTNETLSQVQLSEKSSDKSLKLAKQSIDKPLPKASLEQKKHPLEQKTKSHKIAAKAKSEPANNFDESSISQGLITHNRPAENVKASFNIVESVSEPAYTDQHMTHQQENHTVQMSITEQHLFAIGTKLSKTSLSSTLKPAVYKEAKDVITPKKPVLLNAKELRVVNPVYPQIAKRKGIELEVKVNFTIDVDGRIKNINFARQSKLSYFKSSIRSAIKQWKYVPAKLNNQPIESNMSKIFSFNLQS
ncbi:MAG: M56 family metallopeptidase [Colwellia sp.]